MKRFVLPIIFVSLLVSFVAIFSLSGETTKTPSVQARVSEPTPAPTPFLPEIVGNLVEPTLTAKGVLVLDMDTLAVLYQKNPDEPFYPASTTKLMTALVALDSFPLDKEVTLPKIKIDGQKMGLYGGEKVTIESLLYGMLVASANDAAEALSELYPSGRDHFIQAMNDKARVLGLKNTQYKNPSGLDDDGQFVSAYDLVFLGVEVMKHSELARIVGTKEVKLEVPNGKHVFSNVNELIGSVPGVVGIKTGWTEVAGQNLLTEVDRDGRRIMIAVLGSDDRFGETRTLIDWVFSQYKWN